MGNIIVDCSRTAMNFGNVIEMGSSRCKHESDKTNRSSLAALGAEISLPQKTENGKRRILKATAAQRSKASEEPLKIMKVKKPL
jgi:hypothetical protein